MLSKQAFAKCKKQAQAQSARKDHMIWKTCFPVVTSTYASGIRPVLPNTVRMGHTGHQSEMDKSINAWLPYTGLSSLFVNFFNTTMACAHFPSWSQPKEWTVKEVYLAKPAHSLLFMHNSTFNKPSYHDPDGFVPGSSLILLQCVRNAEIRSLNCIQQR